MFKQLKAVAEKYMVEIGQLCNERYTNLCCDRCGQELAHLDTAEHVSTTSAPSVSGDFNSIRQPIRQDDEEVLPSLLVCSSFEIFVRILCKLVSSDVVFSRYADPSNRDL